MTRMLELQFICAQCGLQHTLSLSDDIPLHEKLNCSSCGSSMGTLRQHVRSETVQRGNSEGPQRPRLTVVTENGKNLIRLI